MADAVRVEGYRELMLALKTADTQSRRAARAELRHAGDKVKQGATDRFDRYDPKSAHGYRVRVRQRGIAVEQSLRRTTGKHPQFGTLQMAKALVPSLEANEEETMRGFDDAFDKISLIFNGGL